MDQDISFVNAPTDFVFYTTPWGKKNSQSCIPYAIEGLGFGKTDNSTNPKCVPDYEIMFTATSYATDGGSYQRVNHRLTDDFYTKAYAGLNALHWGFGFDTISTDCMVLHPKSTGKVTLRDANPLSPPKIYPNTFDDLDDKYTLLQCVRKAQAIFSSSFFKPYDPTLYRLDIDACNILVFDSNDYWYCVFDYISTSMYHEVGTCRMGNTTGDATAVVGPDLKVIGMSNLRVADSSVIRDVISGHTAAITMATGEKCADMVKATNSLIE